MATADAGSETATFVMVLPEKPLSQQANGRRKYQQRIGATAAARFVGRSSFTGEVYVRITYCQEGPPKQDIDNIIKSIVDALKGVVMSDDIMVRQCSADRIFLDRDFTISDRSRSVEAHNALAALLAQGAPDILYIEVGVAPDQRIAFGPMREMTG